MAGATRRAPIVSDGAADRYLYESLESDFKRELLVDLDGFVIDYPGVWQRD
jgi:hypothetical protein